MILDIMTTSVNSLNPQICLRKLKFSHRKCSFADQEKTFFENLTTGMTGSVIDPVNPVIVCVGVTVTRYVTQGNARSWLIHAYKNMKGRGVNKPPVSVQEEEKKSSSSLGIGHKLDSKTAMTAGTMTSSAGTSHHTRSHSRLAQSAQRSQEKAPLWTKTSISMEQSQAPPPISTYDIVCLVCRPWRKPEGALNRPVLLMMLRAIMMYVMSCPGCTQPDIAIKFNPILQPQAVLELIEMLEDLGAITRTVIQVEHRSSLFSRRTLYANTSDDVCREGNVVSFEANIDCVMRVGQFCSTLE